VFYIEDHVILIGRNWSCVLIASFYAVSCIVLSVRCVFHVRSCVTMLCLLVQNLGYDFSANQNNLNI
jgi:hypothetical protein